MHCKNTRDRVRGVIWGMRMERITAQALDIQFSLLQRWSLSAGRGSAGFDSMYASILQTRHITSSLKSVPALCFWIESIWTAWMVRQDRGHYRNSRTVPWCRTTIQSSAFCCSPPLPRHSRCPLHRTHRRCSWLLRRPVFVRDADTTLSVGKWSATPPVEGIGVFGRIEHETLVPLHPFADIIPNVELWQWYESASKSVWSVEWKACVSNVLCRDWSQYVFCFVRKTQRAVILRHVTDAKQLAFLVWCLPLYSVNTNNTLVAVTISALLLIFQNWSMIIMNVIEEWFCAFPDVFYDNVLIDKHTQHTLYRLNICIALSGPIYFGWLVLFGYSRGITIQIYSHSQNNMIPQTKEGRRRHICKKVGSLKKWIAPSLLRFDSRMTQHLQRKRWLETFFQKDPHHH